MTQKIFCVGLNKTGTTSLHRAFKILGLKSVHYRTKNGQNIKEIIEENYLAGHNILKGIEGYDAYSDWDKPPYAIDIIKEFDRQYPGSKFILNSRDIVSWLDSREKHVKRNQEKKRKHPNKDIKWLTVERDLWRAEFVNHYREVSEYFNGREHDLMEISIIQGDGWEKLCPFLSMEIPNKAFPFDNVAADKTNLLNRLKSTLKKLF